ncbi:helix-turn-helix domain-containing protein [Enterococcus sp. LJL98]
MDIGSRIKTFRRNNHLTQKELGEQLNVSDKTISSWETGRTYPDISTIIEMSNRFNLSLDEFLKGDKETVKKIDDDLKKGRSFKKIILVGVFLFVVLFTTVNLIYYQKTKIYREQYAEYIKKQEGLQTGK